MTLYNLNQAVHNINKFTAEFQGQRHGTFTIYDELINDRKKIVWIQKHIIFSFHT